MSALRSAGNFIERGVVYYDITTPSAVQRASAEAMRMALDEEIVAIPLAGLGRMYAMRGDVLGFEPHPSQLNQQWNRISRVTPR